MVERTGIMNLGTEGAIIAGALGAAVTATSAGAEAGLLGGAMAGLVVSAVFALFVLWLGTEQIITGTALTIGSLGLTSALYRVLFGASGAGLTIPTLPALRMPGLAALPIIGPPFFQQPVTTFLLYILTGFAAWFLFRTPAGLSWRATGERPEAASAAGIATKRLQLGGVLVGGALGGLSGAALVLGQVGTFAEGMSAGRGFIAIAIVALGRWHPMGALAAALLFGAATAAQFLFQALGSSLPYQLFLAIPYLLALAVLAGGIGRTRAPAALGKRLFVSDNF
jgi:simple sugar transport system permease protein